MDRKDELDKIMRDWGVTARQVGDVVGVAPKTVRNWRSSKDRDIPPATLELLRIKAAAGVFA